MYTMPLRVTYEHCWEREKLKMPLFFRYPEIPPFLQAIHLARPIHSCAAAFGLSRGWFLFASLSKKSCWHRRLRSSDLRYCWNKSTIEIMWLRLQKGFFFCGSRGPFSTTDSYFDGFFGARLFDFGVLSRDEGSREGKTSWLNSFTLSYGQGRIKIGVDHVVQMTKNCVLLTQVLIF